MNNPLDFDQSEDYNGQNFSEIVRWWERKRLIYNMILLACGLLNIFLQHKFKTTLIVPMIFYGILANLFYSTGILIEAWDHYYFKGKLKMGNYRIGLYILGTLISAFITAVIKPHMFF